MSNQSDTQKHPRVTVLTAQGEDLPPGMEPLRDQAEVSHADDRQSLESSLPGSRVLVVTDFNTNLLEKAWPKADKVEWIHATSAGVDAVLFPDVVKSDVRVTNARGIFDRAIGEYVLGLTLAFAKDFPKTLALQRDSRWQHRDSERIVGKRMLVVGAGAIGRAIARLAHAAGLKVEGTAGHARDDDPDFSAVYASDDLHDVLPEADYVVIAAPLTESTRHMFDAEALHHMKSSARLINIGRGPIVDTDALVEALKQEKLAGAALDVFEEEPLPEDSPLWQMDNVIVSPHMAGDFIGWREALSEQFLENFQRWREGEALFNVVDKERGYVPPDQ